MSITQNKLTPLLVLVAVGIVGYVVYVKATAPSAPVASGAPLTAAPQPGVDPALAPKASGGVFGASALPPTRTGDADNNAETLATVTASNRELRTAVQRVIDENEALKRQNVTTANNEEAIAARVRTLIQAEAATARAPGGVPAANNSATSNPVTGLIDNGLSAATQMINGIGGQPGTPAAIPAGATPSMQGTIPTGLGYDGSATAAAAASAPGTGLTRVIAPLGYRAAPGTGNDRDPTLMRTSLAAKRVEPMPGAPTPQGVSAPTKPELIPYFTIPENATLGRSTAMTTMVGRVPIDGRVQDPMQFKLVVDRDNLAASGQYVPDDISGAVISGIAVGDMALSCTEGLIQSITFVFDDGTIRTVSQRSNGASTGFGSSGGGGGGSSGGGGVGGQSLAAASKLGWISDEFGNPCIPGKFVTNAPAYLSDVVGAKALSAIGGALAAAQTTTTSGSSALGGTTSSTVTGNQGQFVLGKVASSGSDELVNWLTKRLNNSFDAVVVRAGTRVAVHIDQAITIDKDPEGRKLDYARGRSTLAQQQGARYGSD